MQLSSPDGDLNAGGAIAACARMVIGASSLRGSPERLKACAVQLSAGRQASQAVV